MEVPLSNAVAVVEVNQVEVMFTPGATISTQLPKLLKLAKPSVIELAATVIAPGVRAGELAQASLAELPAATTTVSPLETKDSTDASRVLLIPPPKLRFTTAGVPTLQFWAIQSRPETTPDR
jgi:hypothetical protein